MYRRMRRRAGVTWGTPVESMIVGGRAYVMCFNDRKPDRAMHWLRPGDRIESWSDSPLPDQIDSFRLLARPPGKGELGYEEYVGAKLQKTKHKSQRHLKFKNAKAPKCPLSFE